MFAMKKQVLAAALLCSLVAGTAMAQQPVEGPWMVRARAVHLNSANGDSTGLGLSINDKWIPEADISYFFNKNVAVELVLTANERRAILPCPATGCTRAKAAADGCRLANRAGGRLQAKKAYSPIDTGASSYQKKSK